MWVGNPRRVIWILRIGSTLHLLQMYMFWGMHFNLISILCITILNDQTRETPVNFFFFFLWPCFLFLSSFQEIVPLNAGNVLGSEDNGPARKWVALVRRTLNNLIGSSSNGSNQTPSPVPNPVVEMDDDFEGSSTRQKNPSFFHRRSFQSLSHSLAMDGDIMAPQPRLERRYSVCDRVIFGSRASDFDSNFRWGVSSDDDYITTDSPSTTFFSPMSNAHSSTSLVDRDRSARLSRCIFSCSAKFMSYFLHLLWFLDIMTFSMDIMFS